MSDAPNDESSPAASAKPAETQAAPPPPPPPGAEAQPGAEMHAAPPPPPPPPPPAAASDAPAKKSRGGLWALSLLVLALALVGTAPYWAPSLLPLLPWGQQPEAGTEALARRLDAMEAAEKDSAAEIARLAAQAQQPAASGAAAAPDLRPIIARLDALEQRIAALPTPPDTTALTQSVQQMGARLDAMDAKLGKLAAAEAAGDEGDRALLAAIAELRAALAGSGPFDGELQGVMALAHGDMAVTAALQPLASEAATGLPNAALLAATFRTETAPAILRAAAQAPPAQGSLGDRILAKLKGLVTIRHIGATGASDDPGAVAVRAAETALDKGDLAGAVTALQGLGGATADAAQPFVAAAKRRLDAEGAVSGLAQKIMARLATNSPPQQESH